MTSRSTGASGRGVSAISPPPSALASCSSFSERRASLRKAVAMATARSREASSGQFGDKPLRLRQRGGDRRAQLMRAVGGEAALGFERVAQPADQGVDRNRDGRDLRGQSGARDRLRDCRGPGRRVRPGTARRA